MAWYSVLPSHLTIYETWIVRTFIILAVVNMAPWICLIIYDLLLWIFRTLSYEFPVYGGRAQGQTRPRAPSLVEHNRRMSIAGLISGASLRRPSVVEDRTLRAQTSNKSHEFAIEEEEPEKS